MLGITMTASGFSGAANVLASPISPRWATSGTARRVASRSYQNEAAHAPDRTAERQRKLRQFNRYPEHAA